MSKLICANCDEPDFKHDGFGFCPDINMKRFVEKIVIVKTLKGGNLK